jgi:DNA-binding NtrC family response regulator
LFKEFIEESGYPAIGFTSPLVTLDHINNYHDKFGLVLIDYEMPEMKGGELARKISEIDPYIKMILITAYNDIANNTLNLELIRKPIKLKYLLDIITRYMSHTII